MACTAGEEVTRDECVKPCCVRGYRQQQLERSWCVIVSPTMVETDTM